MVGMILVDNSGPYPPWFLDHAEWNGLTPADLIFPSFLFIMGMAVPLATTKAKPVRVKNIIRIAALFLIGVFLNLLSRKFTFDHCIIFHYFSQDSGHFATVEHMLRRYIVSSHNH
jgi:predicted acyltransferase